MNRGAILWGAVGGLSFLVLLTGYELWTGWRASLVVKFGVAALVALVATAVTALIADRFLWNERA